jgi:hypothetical protein
MRRALLSLLLTAASLPVLAQTPQIALEVYRPADPAALSMGRYQAPGTGAKVLELSVGIGSAAFRGRKDAPLEFWTAGDRGPNIACSDVEKVLGVKAEELCAAAPKGRVYPRPDYVPSIYRIALDPATKTFAVTGTIPLKVKGGKPASGLLNPLTVATTETALDGMGRPLSHDPDGVDLEGIVRLPDGRFMLGDENGPSVLEVAADGTILKRHVPAGTEKDYAAAGYETLGSLPALLARRATNRGIESMALSPDGATLFFILQNPLMNPDSATYGAAVNARLFRMEAATGRITGEFVYAMDPVADYPGEKSKANSTVRISELTALDNDRLVVLERTEQTTRLYEVTLSAADNISGSRWDEVATSPSLEQVTAGQGGFRLLPKVRRLDTAAHKEIPVKVEGVALTGDGRVMIVNDNDFGIEGAETVVILLKDTGIITE